MNLSPADITAFWLTIKLAAVTTVILLLFGSPLAWWLARSQSRFKFIVEAIVALPLVLPPTVLGFYLLIALGQHGPIGGLAAWLGLGPIAFTFTGLVIGSACYSLPFVIQPLQTSFSTVDTHLMETAASLGASKLDQFFSIALPLAKPGVVAAVVLGFAHTLGEFGVVLMIGGNIPGETQLLSVAIYDHVESLEYAQAHKLSALLLLISFAMLLAVYAGNFRLRLSR